MTARRPRVRSDLAVVLCTYNGAAHVEAQVRSILGQTVLPGAIRVFDDGSTDDTLDVVRAAWRRRGDDACDVALVIAAPAPGSLGAAQNFSRGMAASPEALLALSDQDDEWAPERLAAAMALLDADPSVELVVSDATMTDGDGAAVGRTVFEAQRLTRRERNAFDRHDYLPVFVRRNIAPGMTFTLRRELVARLGPLPPGAMHDYWLAAAAAARGTLRVVPRPLVRYRIHGGNAVGLDTGARGLRDRVGIKLRAFRDPLTDLPQWVHLPERLVAMGDRTAAERLRGKLDFEIARRRPGESGASGLRGLARLLAGDAYSIYEFQGRGAGLRDLVRRRDPHLMETSTARRQ